MSLRPCLEPTCPELIRAPANRCQKHESHHERAYRASRQYLGYQTARWRRTSASYLKAHPVCGACRRVPSVLVHHLDGSAPSDPRGLDPTNFLGVCRRCHGELHRQETV